MFSYIDIYISNNYINGNNNNNNINNDNDNNN